MTTAPTKKNKSEKTPAAASPLANVDLDQVERLLEFMTAHGLEEFEYEHSGLRVRLRKAPSTLTAARHSEVRSETPAASSIPPASSSRSADLEPPASRAEPSAAPPATEELHIVKSPIVGTFYAAGSPEAKPFVAIGDMIQEGTVICIIEAMKLMNEIEADVSGELVRVLAENGHPVEYGQPLFAIRPVKSEKK